MNALGNIIWLVFGGLIMAVEYILLSIVLILTIVGVPFGIQTMKLATLALWPFGKEAVPKAGAKTSGCIYLLVSIIWLFIGGLALAIQHVVVGLIFCITIIGIPFGKQHFKLAGLALMPFGKEIREKSKM